ncbi:MAG: dihydroflavonol-4-reductase [Myxococcota bacterium]
MKILVTGGTGQIGGALARALVARGDEVSCLVRDPARLSNLEGAAGITLIQGDVTDPSSLAAATRGAEAVLHAAGVISYDSDQIEQMRTVNVQGTRNMLDAAAASGVRRFVLTSSIAGLGWVPGDAVGDEQTAWNWHGMGMDYMQSKLDAQDLALAERRLETVAVLPGIVIGQGDISGNGVRLLRQLHSGQVPVSPPGATTVTSLSDAIGGHLLALDSGQPGEGYIIGTWHGAFHELYCRISTELGCAPPRMVIPAWAVQVIAHQRYWFDRLRSRAPRISPTLARVITHNRRYSSQKAMDALGFSPGPLEEGIQACWRWAQQVDAAR